MVCPEGPSRLFRVIVKCLSLNTKDCWFYPRFVWEFMSLELLLLCFGLHLRLSNRVLSGLFLYPNVPPDFEILTTISISLQTLVAYRSCGPTYQGFFRRVLSLYIVFVLGLAFHNLICLHSLLCQTKTVLFYYIFVFIVNHTCKSRWDVVCSKTYFIFLN